MTTKDEAEQKEAPISDLEITGTLIQARDAMAPMRGLILFDQAIERINKLLAQQKEAQQEPVAWMHYEDESVLTSHEKDVNVADLSPDFLAGHNTPLYTAPVTNTALLREALERMESFALWADSQADAKSKGGHATFDIMELREQRDMTTAAIAAIREQLGETK